MAVKDRWYLHPLVLIFFTFCSKEPHALAVVVGFQFDSERTVPAALLCGEGLHGVPEIVMRVVDIKEESGDLTCLTHNKTVFPSLLTPDRLRNKQPHNCLTCSLQQTSVVSNFSH
jgi:hypothetical protein